MGLRYLNGERVQGIISPQRWLAVSLMPNGSIPAGTVLADLPGIVTKAPSRRTINAVETQDVDLMIDSETNSEWVYATKPKTAALIAYIDLPDGTKAIEWGGIITKRKRTASNTVALSLATPECYFDDRFTGAYTTDPSGIGATVDQNVIAQTLINNFVSASNGIPFTVVIVGAAGTPRFELYNDFDDKTVLSTLQALAALNNGIQLTAWWTWNTNGTITPTAYIGSRIGTASTPGLQPAVTFDVNNLIEFSVEEDSTKGKAANDVGAVGNGQGLSRPMGVATATSFGNQPRIQFRYNPQTSIWDTQSLAQHAAGALGLLQNGTTIVSLKASATEGPILGIDWNLGDDIAFNLTGPAFPTPYVGVGTAISYETDGTYTSPILFAPQPN